MEPFLLYLLKSGSCLAVFYICFKLLLSGDTFFRFNRWILLVGTALCLALPFCRIPMAQPSPLSAPVNRLETLWLDEPAESGLPASEADPVETQGWDWSVVVGGIYFAGCCVSLLLTLLSFYRMKRLAKEGRRIRSTHETLVILPYAIAPFSWGRSIFLSEEDYRAHPDEILAHERTHLRCRHSADLLYMEAVCLLQWFNPAAWLLKRELRDIHEFEADEGVLNQGIDATKYQLLLVKKAVGSRLYSLANSFNHSKLKKRITMMLKRRSNKWGRLKLALLIPVGLAALSAFARPETEATLVPIPVTPPPPVANDVGETSQPSSDKGTHLQADDKVSYNVYLSFTKTNDEGKEVIGGIAIYGVGEQKALEVVQKNIQSGRFAAATKVVICPHTPQIPKDYMQRIKALFDAENIPCEITTAQGYDKNGNKLPTPPPPPPAPDVFVSLSDDQGTIETMNIYAQYLKTSKKIDQWLKGITLDRISTVTIKEENPSRADIAHSVEQYLRGKLGDNVKYVIEKKE